jgi:hypothetical protein
MPQETTTKARTVITPMTLAGWKSEGWGNLSDTVVADISWTRKATREVLTSTGHKGPPYKEGGPFSVTRYTLERVPLVHNAQFSESDASGTNGRTWYKSGLVFANFTLSGLPATISASQIQSKYNSMVIPSRDLNSYGATAINRFSPLNPGASLGQTIVETYREGLPQIPVNLLKRVRDFLKSPDLTSGVQDMISGKSPTLQSAGKDYLTVVFGWKPLLSDLRACYDTWNSLNTKLAQIIRDNNKGIRRRGKLYSNTEVSTPTVVGGSIGFNQGFANQTADPIPPEVNAASQTTKTETTYENIWFAGRFRYYIPDVTDDRWTDRAKLALFGLNPTPALLYEVMPWSWLIDWFSNVGDVISNLSSNGIADLMIDYGYVMRHYKKVTEYDHLSVQTRISGNLKGKLEIKRSFPQSHFKTLIIEESKERVVATPFGFGLQIDDLSARQLAILTALGLSRVNF